MECRRSRRLPAPKRSFSPTVTDQSQPRKRRRVPGPACKDRSFDIDPGTGVKFECERCFSNYIIHPSKRKKNSKKYRLCPRRKPDACSGRLLTLCNSCGLKLDRAASRSDNSRTGAVLTEREKSDYHLEAKHFVDQMKVLFHTPEVERLVCPNVTWKICGCVQNFILSGPTALESKEAERRVQLLLRAAREASRLSQLKFLDGQPPDSSGQKAQRVGLGNGRKKSILFHEYILKQRDYLRKECQFCEKATQKILGYSNNLLYRRLKTEENKARVELKIGKGAKELIGIEELHKHNCCENNCVVLARVCPKMVRDWRERALLGQMDAKIVLGEMLTPSGGLHCNCVHFIAMVTGCCLTTISKMSQQIKSTGGDRQPPEHGLKRYHLQQQQQAQPCSAAQAAPDVTSPQLSPTPPEPGHAYNTTAGQPSGDAEAKHGAPSAGKAARDGVGLCPSSEEEDVSELYPDFSDHLPDLATSVGMADVGDIVGTMAPDSALMAPPGATCASRDPAPNVTIPTPDMLQSLERERGVVLQLQKSLEKKQRTLKEKQKDIERQMLVAVQVKGMVSRSKKHQRAALPKDQRPQKSNTHRKATASLDDHVPNISIISQKHINPVSEIQTPFTRQTVGLNSQRKLWQIQENSATDSPHSVKRKSDLTRGLVQGIRVTPFSLQRDNYAPNVNNTGTTCFAVATPKNAENLPDQTTTLTSESQLQLDGKGMVVQCLVYNGALSGIHADVIPAVPLFSSKEAAVSDNGSIPTVGDNGSIPGGDNTSAVAADSAVAISVGGGENSIVGHHGSENRPILSAKDVFLSSAVTDEDQGKKFTFQLGVPRDPDL